MFNVEVSSSKKLVEDMLDIEICSLALKYDGEV